VSVVTGRARTRLRVAFVAYLAVVAVITMRPAPPDDETLGLARRFVDWLAAAGLPVTLPGMEAVANVVMFVPFGVLVGLLLRRPWWVVVLLGAGTSALIETVQRWLPTRYPTLQDVVMNTLGAAVGVLGLLLVSRRAGTGVRSRPVGGAGVRRRAGRGSVRARSTRRTRARPPT
jgi:VanZ family protein